MKKYKSLPHSLYAIKYAISQNLPVAFGCMVYDNFSDLDENFIVPLPKGQMQGGHALAIVNYNDETKLFKVLNSWGYEFANKGCCYMRYEHLLNPEWAFEFWVITSD